MNGRIIPDPSIRIELSPKQLKELAELIAKKLKDK
jgi:hypothetical protein